MASVVKSSYMISTTGRMPCIAAPIPAPTSAISQIGVLRTRSEPHAQAGERLARSRVRAVVLRAGGVGVAAVVPLRPVGLDVEEARSLTGANPLDRLVRRLEDLLGVLAVDLHRGHVEGAGALRH